MSASEVEILDAEVVTATNCARPWPTDSRNAEGDIIDAEVVTDTEQSPRGNVDSRNAAPCRKCGEHHPAKVPERWYCRCADCGTHHNPRYRCPCAECGKQHIGNCQCAECGRNHPTNYDHCWCSACSAHHPPDDPRHLSRQARLEELAVEYADRWTNAYVSAFDGSRYPNLKPYVTDGYHSRADTIEAMAKIILGAIAHYDARWCGWCGQDLEPAAAVNFVRPYNQSSVLIGDCCAVARWKPGALLDASNRLNFGKWWNGDSKPCGNCGRAIAGWPVRRYCCRVCKRQGEARRRAEARTRTCDYCGEEFTPPRSDANYCRSACRQAAYRKRKKENDE